MWERVPSTSASVDRAQVFRRSHKVPLVKPTLADNTRPRWRFNSAVSPFRVKNREILVARPRYRAMYYPKTTRFPEIPRVSPPLPSHSHPFIHSMCAENYFTSALARLSRQWVLKIFIFWTRGSSGRAADLKGDRLISLKGDNRPDGTPGFDFEVKRASSCPWSKSLPAYRFVLTVFFRGRGGDLIFWFASSTVQPGATDDFPTQWDYHRQLACYAERLTAFVESAVYLSATRALMPSRAGFVRILHD